MSQLFNENSPLVMGVKKVLDLVLLNVLWLLACIPVVTVGMATSAFYDVVYRDIWHGRGMVALDYFAACKRNFRQSLASGVLFAAAKGVLLLDISLLRALADEGVLWGECWLLLAVFAILAGVYFLWVSANVARFDAPFPVILKNSLALCLCHFPVSLAVILVAGAGGLLIWLFPGALFVLPPLCMLACCVLMEGVFRRYMTPEERELEEERNRGWGAPNSKRNSAG